MEIYAGALLQANNIEKLRRFIRWLVASETNMQSRLKLWEDRRRELVVARAVPEEARSRESSPDWSDGKLSEKSDAETIEMLPIDAQGSAPPLGGQGAVEEALHPCLKATRLVARNILIVLRIPPIRPLTLLSRASRAVF